MLTPEQLEPGLLPGRPGTAQPAMVPMVNGLPVRLSLLQRTSTTAPGRERHSLGILFESPGQCAWGPLGEWRWEAN